MQIPSQQPPSGVNRPVDVDYYHGHLEATPVGDCSWRVSDMSVPEEDPRHVVAFVEANSDEVETVWIRGARTAPGRFDDLDSALEAIDDVITTGEQRRSA